jgi:class 3 adenylate cyclase/predicted ATPase
MLCPSCAAEVPEGSNFCEQCGMALPRSCPGCGHVNSTNARFCSKCGANLASPSEVSDRASPVAPLTPNAPSAERRQLTIMFCDMVGSSALSTRLDPEEQREVIAAFHACCANEIKSLGGMVAQYLGDGVLAYFGYPTAHENDAERAILAGLAILKALATLITPTNVAVQTRIAIGSGVVVVGDLIGQSVTQENAAIGETTNLVARLQAIAEPNSIVISPVTHRLVGGLFDCRDLGRHTLKGFSEPVRVRQVLGVSEVESRFEAQHKSGASPLHGREEEIDLLMRRWEQAKSGEGRVVLLTGEPGIGKSRIARALRDRLSSDPHTPLSYFCSPHHLGSSLYPFIGQFARAAGIERDDSADAKLDKLQSLLAQSSGNLPEDMPLVATLLSVPAGDRYPLPEMTPQRRKERTLVALFAQLKGLATRQPVLMLFEDLHWIDPTSLELLSLAIEQIGDQRILLLATARPEFTPPWPGHSHVSTLSLNRLGRSEGEALIASITKGKPLPPQVSDQIIRRTDGVPLFIEELTKTVLESGLLREADDHYELTAPLPPLAIPSTLHASLLARLDRLAAVKDVAQIGAVIGREFSYPLIAAVAMPSEKNLNAALGQLVNAELIYQRGVPPNATYQFKHALVQDAAYSSLVRSRRKQLHERIARALEECFLDVVATEPELLAHHFTEAGVAESAIDYWQKAGRRAAQRSASVEAITHLRKGITVLSTLPCTSHREKRELAFQLDLGVALVMTRGWNTPDAVSVYQRASELAHVLSDDRQGFQASWGLWMTSQTTGNYEAARAFNADLFSISRRLNDPGLLLQAHHSAWATGIWTPELSAVAEHTAQGLALYDQDKHRGHAFLYGGHDAGVCCHGCAALAQWLLGYPHQAERSARQAVSLGEKLSHPPSLAHALLIVGIFDYFRRDGAAILSYSERAVSIAKEHRLALHEAVARVLHGWATVEHGEVERGIAELRRGLGAFTAINLKFFVSCLRNTLVESYARAGDIEAGLTASQEALEAVTASGEGLWKPEVLRVRGDLLIAAERHGDGEACLHQAITVAREQGARALELRAATSLARLWRDQGRDIEAHELLAPVYCWFTEGIDTVDLKDAKALLAELSA